MPDRLAHDLARELAQLANRHWRLDTKHSLDAWCARASVRLERSPGVYAGRYLRDPEPTILLNSNTPADQARFIVAHELAHHLLAECRHNVTFRNAVSDRGRRELGDIGPASDAEETICDQVAGALLLPAPVARDWVQSAEPTLQAVVDLATEYHISVGACVHQLHAVAAFTKTVVVVGPDGTVLEVHGRHWPLAPSARPQVKMTAAEMVSWTVQPRWLTWTPGEDEHIYRTKATGTIDEAGRTTMLIHLVARDFTNM